jgi:Icc-related predicted phosphoesterase
MIKIACVSDLHGFLPVIEPSDLLIIGGDICPHVCQPVTKNDILFQAQWLNSVFNSWLNSLPVDHIIAIPGNHDFVFQDKPYLVDPHLELLIDKFTTYKEINIYGSPWSLYYGGWAFNSPKYYGELFLEEKYNDIPENTNIIISHGGIYGYGDLTDDNRITGSEALLKRAEKLKELKHIITGHIHSDNAIGSFKHINGFEIINASVVNERYELVHNPTYINYGK